MHEQMISTEDAPHTFEYPGHFKILPAINNWSRSGARIKDGIPVAHDFVYASDTNSDWMDAATLRDWIKTNASTIEKF